jgi:hypothetical protein
LLSIGSCSSGLNFASICNTIVFVELAWSPGIHLQVTLWWVHCRLQTECGCRQKIEYIA